MNALKLCEKHTPPNPQKTNPKTHPTNQTPNIPTPTQPNIQTNIATKTNPSPQPANLNSKTLNRLPPLTLELHQTLNIPIYSPNSAQRLKLLRHFKSKNLPNKSKHIQNRAKHAKKRQNREPKKPQKQPLYQKTPQTSHITHT